MASVMITSRQNPAVIAACALADKKARDASGEFFFEGIKLLREAKREKLNIVRVFCTESASKRYAGEIEGDYELVTVSDPVYEKLTSENAPQGVFTIAKKLDLPSKNTGFSVLLDDVADPGNLGTMIRCADAFGVEKIYLGSGCADVYNPKTVRAAMGSLFRVPAERVILTDAVTALRAKGYDVYATMLDENSERVSSMGKGGKLAVVIGNEGHGVSPAVRDVCTGSVIIPMRDDSAESLNASAAAAILMWENKRI